jgi:arabinogalactan endo-1,4-beta-galactosidase
MKTIKILFIIHSLLSLTVTHAEQFFAKDADIGWLPQLEKVKAVPNGKGIGVFYWDPEGARSWSHYGLSCWGEVGKPTKALDAFK